MQVPRYFDISSIEPALVASQVPVAELIVWTNTFAVNLEKRYNSILNMHHINI